MSNEQDERRSRREFLGGLAVAGTAGLLGLESGRLMAGLLRPQLATAAEPPPETTTIRLLRVPAICTAPQYFAEELLRAEGFTDVQYVKRPGPAISKTLGSGEADMSMNLVGSLVIPVDAGRPIVLLAGVHIGCFELFGTDRIRTIRDLKGKTVAVTGGLGSSRHVFLSSMAAYVGLDPRKDINWVDHSPPDAMRLLAEGKVDAFMAFPPEPQELRAKKIGHVVVNTMMDRPWSQYFCCLVAANRDFIRKHPVATKRALRAILKAADITAREPERVARFLVDKGYTERYDYAVQAMREVPYGRWRELDPEDTVRFSALRLREVGMIKSSPQKIITQATDWRFLRELKKEMKG